MNILRTVLPVAQHRGGRRPWRASLSFALAVITAVVGGGASLAALPAAAATADTGSGSTPAKDYTSLVDPFVSTAGDDGNDLPGAEAPHSLAKVNPLTTPNRNHTGYDYNEDQIAGFTTTNLDGVGGSGGGGDILVVPTGVQYTSRPTTSTYAHDYAHTNETATPGYYQVGLGPIGGTASAVTKQSGTINAEATVTTRTGLERYSFPAGTTPSLVVDLANNFTSRTRSSLTATTLSDGTTALSGTVVGTFNGPTYQLYYYATTTSPISSLQSWGDTGTLSSATSRSGTDTGAILTFPSSAASDVELRITVSPISVQQAAIDQQKELAGLSFDQVRAQTKALWNSTLGAVDVTSTQTSDPDSTLTQEFYTHLYRMYAAPVNATSTSGTYRGVDGVVHKANGFTYYDGWSSWDDFRKYSVDAYIDPATYRDMVQSLINLFADAHSAGKSLSSLTQSVPTVRWERSAVIIADALSKGYTRFDRLDEAYPAVKSLTGFYTGAQLRAGYIPNDPGTAVGRGYDQWALAIIADALGKKADAAKLRAQSELPIQNLIKPGAWTATDGTQVGLLSPRTASGDWTSVNYEQFEAASLYQGTLWQYNWYDAYDMAGLIKAMGGDAAGKAAIEHMFGEDSSKNDGSTMLHSNANEIDLQAPYLFNYVGEPNLTQKWVRAIYTGKSWNRYIATGSTNEAPSGGGEFTPPVYRNVYSLSPQGFLPTMDNDAGTMSTMFVAAALGLFPVTAGSSQFQIGSPFFDSTTIRYADGTHLTVKADGVSPSSYYVQSATLNGKAFDNTWLDYSQIIGGGELDFTMGSSASHWGESTAAAYSASTTTDGSQPATGATTVSASPSTIAADADGTVSGSTTLTLSGPATFAGAKGTSLTDSGAAAVSGLSTGVTADVEVTGSQSARVTLHGTVATDARFTIAFHDDAFANGVSASTVTGAGVSATSPIVVSAAASARSALQKLVDEATLVRKARYSTASFTAFQAALQRAQTALADTGSATGTLLAAAESLQGVADALGLDEGGYRVLQAEAADAQEGPSLKAEAYYSDGDLGGVTDGSWIRYDLDFAGVGPKSLAIRYANSQPSTNTPSSVDVHAGDINGPIVATVPLPGTNSWQNYTTVQATITDASALLAAKQVTFGFHAPSGQAWVSNFDWLQFSADPVPTSSGPTAIATLTAATTSSTGGGTKPLNTANGIFENTTNGAYGAWTGVNLAPGADTVTVSYDKPSTRAASDSAIVLHLGSTTGTPSVTIPLAYTGSGWGTVGTATATIDPALFTGVKDVYAVFTSTTQTDAQPYVANVYSISLGRSSNAAVTIPMSTWVTNSDAGKTAVLKKETSAWSDGTVTDLGATYNGAWLDYGTVDFGSTQKNTMSVHYVYNSARCGTGSAVQLYLDSFNATTPGTPFATLPLTVTAANWTTATTTSLTLPSGVTGAHHVWARLVTNPYDSNHPFVANFDTMKFTHVDVAATVDTSALTAAVQQNAGLEDDGARYDTIDFAVLTRELAAARDLLKDSSATQHQVDVQTRALSLAAAQLSPRVRLQLQQLADQASALQNARYTDDSWSALQAALASATATLGDDTATDDAVATSRDALSAALAALATKPQVVPAAPSAASATASGVNLTIGWAAPSEDGGSAITGYVVTLSDGHEVTVTDPSARATTFSWLKPDVSYTARVAAVNAVGRSTASEATIAVTVKAAASATTMAAADAVTTTDPAAYTPSPYTSEQLNASYSSDSWPATKDGSPYFDALLSGIKDLDSTILGKNAVQSHETAITAENDSTAVAINNAASQAQVDRAVVDANNDSSITMSDGLGSRLGQIYLDALKGGQLPKTNALFGRVRSSLDQVDTAKNDFGYLRPYVRLGFVGDGGAIYESQDGGYSGLATSGSYPSGHTYGGYEVGTILATLLPELAPSILARASEYGDNRIVLGYHYPLDVMGGRMTAQATVAHRWADADFAGLLQQAHEEIENVLLQQCETKGYGDTLAECSGDAYDGMTAAQDVDTYTQRLSYGFSQVGEAGQKITVPADAAALLATAFPALTTSQRTQILEQTATDSGYPLDLTADGDASWQRVNLAAAMTAQYVVNADGSVTVTNYANATDDSHAQAASISIGGTALGGFDADTDSYVVDWPTTAAIPEVTATGAEGATVAVRDGGALASDAAGFVTRQVVVTSKNGSQSHTYSVGFFRTADDHRPGAGTAPGGGGGTPGDGGTGTGGNGGTTTPGGGTTAPAPANAVLPRVTGIVRVGSTVTATSGTWSPKPSAYHYQWSVGGKAVKGATSSHYTLPASAAGKKLTVSVTAVSAAGSTKASSKPVTVARGTLTHRSGPRVVGTAQVGHRVRVSTGTWTPRPKSYHYQWLLGGKAIRGATHSTYTVSSTARGKRLSVRVTAAATGYTTASANSAAVTVRARR